MADTSYPADFTHNTIVPSYKTSSLGSEKEDFNKCVAHVRVVNEHTIGVLKGRWSSLRELRVQIRQNEDMNRVLLWLSDCVVLHNIMLLFDDDWPSDGESSGSDSDGENSGSDDEDPYTFRRRIKAKAIARGRAPGGILRRG
ncbi:DDE superfamily endonuclease [Phytophthora infestans]|uniref:DDE superfamily endonuclease n=1 Tax=Phytophthora infestans TaxID=4787 RepID=A0A833WC75_PHYIN|nr:DDE superfamily endonuclease [Phytophthora infestans]KAF4137672.1 DDE superfamily endonuclease [Phytophthora infestans]KAF4146676.1 DDE superfamily endonuclease [Phytophthora infestans]